MDFSGVRIIPIGGFGEIGKNSFVIETKEDMVLVDCGIIFPNTEEHPGVSKIAPDFTYVFENKKKLRAVLITHGHEDHIGAVPYFIKQLNEKNIPFYATRFTATLIRAKLEEDRLRARIIEFDPDSDEIYVAGKTLRFEPFRVTHSIPDAVGYAFETPGGLVVHTGDFKMDHTPVDGKQLDIDKLYRFRQQGVRALICDTTSVVHPGTSLSEKEVSQNLAPYIRFAPRAVFVAAFASNIHRIGEVLKLADEAGRSIIVTGFSMERNILSALESGVLDFPAEKLLGADQFKDLEPEKVLVVTTGSQGEPLGGLSKIVSGVHKEISLEAGDRVILSASPIPGNERSVNNLINNIMVRGAEVIHTRAGHMVHASGHAHREEVKWMIRLLRPQLLLPFHGEEMHIAEFTRVASLMGYEREKVLDLRLGDAVTIEENDFRIENGIIETGMSLIDGHSIGVVGNRLLQERIHIRDEGVVFAVVGVTDRSKVTNAEVITRGVFYNGAETNVTEQARLLIRTVSQTFLREKKYEPMRLRIEIQYTLTNYFFHKTGRRPMVIPVVLET